MPSYQRLLLPSRLKGITKFIDGGGYFPNSAILNINEREAKHKFQGQVQSKDSASRTVGSASTWREDKPETEAVDRRL